MDELFVEPFIEHQGERRAFWLRKPRPLGKTFLLAAAGTTLPSRAARDRTVIFLGIQHAFGTGGHGTTEGCLLALEEHLRPGGVVLDVGTGSGILAVAAAKLGATRVTAVDISAAACEETRRNAALNGVGGVLEVVEGSVGSARGKFDVVVANLRTPILAAIMAALAGKVETAGLLILSGILEREAAAFLPLAGRFSFDVADRKRICGWVTLVLRRGEGFAQRPKLEIDWEDEASGPAE